MSKAFLITLKIEVFENETEEQAIEYMIMKDIPQHIWRDYEKSNKPRLVICTKSQLPQKRTWRNAWRIKEDININNEEMVA